MKKVILEKLKQNIQQNPANLQACFRQTAKQVGCSPEIVNNNYYNKWRKTETFFVTQTPQGIQINTKNSLAIKETKTSVVLENKLIPMQEFGTAEKVILMDMLMGN